MIKEEIKINGEVSKEFPLGKENYCPKCYFGEPPSFVGRIILRKECPHNQ